MLQNLATKDLTSEELAQFLIPYHSESTGTRGFKDSGPQENDLTEASRPEVLSAEKDLDIKAKLPRSEVGVSRLRFKFSDIPAPSWIIKLNKVLGIGIVTAHALLVIQLAFVMTVLFVNIIIRVIVQDYFSIWVRGTTAITIIIIILMGIRCYKGALRNTSTTGCPVWKH